MQERFFLLFPHGNGCHLGRSHCLLKRDQRQRGLQILKSDLKHINIKDPDSDNVARMNEIFFCLFSFDSVLKSQGLGTAGCRDPSVVVPKQESRGL